MMQELTQTEKTVLQTLEENWRAFASAPDEATKLFYATTAISLWTSLKVYYLARRGEEL